MTTLGIAIPQRCCRAILNRLWCPAGVDFWTPVSPLTPSVDVLVSPEVQTQLTDQLTRAGVSYTVNIDYVQVSLTCHAWHSIGNGVYNSLLMLM